MPRWGGGLRRRLSLASRRRIGAALAQPLFAIGFGGATLGARGNAPPTGVPVEPWPGDSGNGATVAAGRFTMQGQTVPAYAEGGAAPWDGNGATEAWRAALHGFEFLRDLRALGGEAARITARRLVDDWIAHETRIRSIAWRPDVLAQRLMQWLMQADFVCAGADDGFRARFHAALARQANYLARAAALAPEGSAQIAVHKALIYACLTLPGARRRIGRWTEALEHDIAEQVLVDGAINRLGSASPRVSDGLVMATGGLVADSLDDVVESTAATLEMLTVPEAPREVRDLVAPQTLNTVRALSVDEEGHQSTLELDTVVGEGVKVAREVTRLGSTTLFIGGALTEEFVDDFTRVLAPRRTLRVVVRDATVLILPPMTVARLRRRGVDLRVLTALRVLAVTTNPFRLPKPYDPRLFFDVVNGLARVPHEVADQLRATRKV